MKTFINLVAVFSFCPRPGSVAAPTPLQIILHCSGVIVLTQYLHLSFLIHFSLLFLLQWRFSHLNPSHNFTCAGPCALLQCSSDSLIISQSNKLSGIVWELLSADTAHIYTDYTAALHPVTQRPAQTLILPRPAPLLPSDDSNQADVNLLTLN